MNSLILITLLATIQASTSTPDIFFPNGDAAGDTVLVDLFNDVGTNNNDDSLFFVNTDPIPILDVHNATRFQLSTNGYIAIGDTDYNQNTPSPFENINVPIIAAFYSDLIFIHHLKSLFCYQIHDYSSYAVIHKAKIDVERWFHTTFNPTRVMVVTWKFAENYNAPFGETATFQLALATDESRTYVFFHYTNITYTGFTPTAVGWRGATNSRIFHHPLSQLVEDPNDSSVNKPLRLQYESNLDGGSPGQWIFNIAKPVVVTPPTEEPQTTSYIAPCPYFEAEFCHYKEVEGSFYHSGHWYIVCENGHAPRCLACASETQHFDEYCNECLSEGQTCTVHQTTTPATTVYVPYEGCTQKAAAKFCKHKYSGMYENPLDVLDYSFYWCYGVGSACMRCPAGTAFCLLSSPGETSAGGCLHIMNQH